MRTFYDYCSKSKLQIGLRTVNGSYEGRIAFPTREDAKQALWFARQADQGRSRREYMANVWEAVEDFGAKRV